MSKNRRVYVPEITGEFAEEDEVLSRAREFFLIMVQTYTPRPLVSLRKDVMPKYRHAFAAQNKSGKLQADVTASALHALAKALQEDQPPSVTASMRLKSVQKAPRELQDASRALVAWSKTFNLRGKPPKAEPDDSKATATACCDAVWPLLAALETIFFWHFAPAGWLREHRNPPHWRPPVPLLKAIPFTIETLPAIQLRSTVPWQPTTPEERAAVDALHDNARHRLIEVLNTYEDGSDQGTKILDDLRAQMESYPKESEIDATDWAIGVELEDAFRTRIQASFQNWLERHIFERKDAAEKQGLIKVPEPRDPHHFKWAAQYQVDKLSSTLIARQCPADLRLTPSGTTKAIEEVLQALRLEPRSGTRGPKRI